MSAICVICYQLAMSDMVRKVVVLLYTLPCQVMCYFRCGLIDIELRNTCRIVALLSCILGCIQAGWHIHHKDYGPFVVVSILTVVSFLYWLFLDRIIEIVECLANGENFDEIQNKNICPYIDRSP